MSIYASGVQAGINAARHTHCHNRNHQPARTGNGLRDQAAERLRARCATVEMGSIFDGR